MSGADLAIRLQRAAFNRALADGDLDAIGRVLTRDAILVTGTDSVLISGRKAQLATWKREFQARERTTYTRTPESVTASSIEPGALEQGEWRCVAAASGEHVAAGSYSAKWREIGGLWLIEAELFLTLS